jgi:hypothetical protein
MCSKSHSGTILPYGFYTFPSIPQDSIASKMVFLRDKDAEIAAFTGIIAANVKSRQWQRQGHPAAK